MTYSASRSHKDSSAHPDWDTLLHNATLATMQVNDTPYGLIERGAVAFKNGRIAWLGAQTDLPEHSTEGLAVVDVDGKLITPGLIDCHTHLVYGGHRAAEFERRLNGASYAEIAEQGGGIVSTVNATRAATEEELFASASARLQTLMRQGVTTFEIKSGYGLDTDNELKMLRVARALGDQFPVDVVTTFLGAHALPPEFQGRADDYISLVCDHMLPAAARLGLADAVDAFCENIAFTTAQVERVFEVAQDLNLPIKLHAEQLSNMQGAALAARRGALSVDHLEYLADEDIPLLAEHDCVAVLLPGAFYYLGESRLPPIAGFRQHGVPMALASDHNPGSSPMLSFSLVLNMGCVLFGMTPEEALSGVTRHAAQALGLQQDIGTLEVGKRANVALWDTQTPADLSYSIGGDLCLAAYHNGRFNPG